jgi:acetyltransferase-like isoleucine patch superfamily enzyme
MNWRDIIGFGAQFALSLAYRAHKADGLNSLFLIVPARFAKRALVQHGAVIADNVELHTPIIFHNVSGEPGEHYANLRIGPDSYLGKDVFIDLAEKVTIEEQVTVSMRVTLITHTHTGKSLLTQTKLPPSKAPIILRKGCYIGAGAIILQGVEIGEEAIVAAGAVVIRNVLPHQTVGGVPAKAIGN